MSIEARAIAERLLAENDWTFTSEIELRRVEVYAHGMASDANADSSATVVWELQPEFRSWGLKALDVIVRRVSVMVKLADWDDDGGETNVRTFEVVYGANAAPMKRPAEDDFKEMAHFLLADQPFQLKVSRRTPESGSDTGVFPTDLTIDLTARSITVDF